MMILMPKARTSNVMATCDVMTTDVAFNGLGNWCMIWRG